MSDDAHHVYEIGTTALHYNKIEELLRNHTRLELSEMACTKIQECRDYLDRKAENPDAPIYGVPIFQACHKTPAFFLAFQSLATFFKFFI